jgi:hypothetical protein
MHPLTHPLTHSLTHSLSHWLICTLLLLLQDPGYVLKQALESESAPSKLNLLEQYAGHLRQQLVEAIDHPQHREEPLSGLKIVVDAGNGSGGFFASQVCVSLCKAEFGLVLPLYTAEKCILGMVQMKVTRGNIRCNRARWPAVPRHAPQQLR